MWIFPRTGVAPLLVLLILAPAPPTRLPSARGTCGDCAVLLLEVPLLVLPPLWVKSAWATEEREREGESRVEKRGAGREDDGVLGDSAGNKAVMEPAGSTGSTGVKAEGERKGEEKESETGEAERTEGDIVLRESEEFS